MKRLCALLLVFVLLFNTSGCSLFGKSEGTTPNHQFVDSIVTDFETLDEIAAFSKSDKAPTNFVLYNSISILGEYDNYFVMTDPVNCRYQYSLIDENQFRFSFKVRSNVEDLYTLKTLLQETDEMENMVYTGTEETGWIFREHIIYTYVEGALRSIIMHIDDLQLIISLACDDLRKYPVDENGNYTTYIERLVFGTEEEALAAADEFIVFFRNNR